MVRYANSSLNDAEITEMLRNTKRIAVVGLSPVPARPSFGVTRYMISHGFEIFGIRPGSPAQILNRPCVERLQDLNIEVDMINVFRNPEALPALVNEIAAFMKSKPAASRLKYLWFQEGVVNAEAEDQAKRLGLKVVSDLCILKEHARLLSSS